MWLIVEQSALAYDNELRPQQRHVSNYIHFHNNYFTARNDATPEISVCDFLNLEFVKFVLKYDVFFEINETERIIEIKNLIAVSRFIYWNIFWKTCDHAGRVPLKLVRIINKSWNSYKVFYFNIIFEKF
jgi:hypothetical protein